MSKSNARQIGLTSRERQQANQCAIAMVSGMARLCLLRHMKPPDRVFHYETKIDPECISSILRDMMPSMLKRFNESAKKGS